MIALFFIEKFRLNYFSTAIHSGNQEGISLTFDDGPNPKFTEKFLDLLKKYDVKATFFIVGKNIEGNEAILKRIVNEGHIIGNHSYKHVGWYNTLSSSKILADIELCNKLIKDVTTKDLIFFRAPFGLTSPNIAKALNKSDHISIGWDFRTFDTMSKDEDQLFNKMKKNAKSSSIMLLHDNNDITYNALEKFLSYCKENGIKIVSLDEMIGIKPYKN